MEYIRLKEKYKTKKRDVVLFYALLLFFFIAISAFFPDDDSPFVKNLGSWVIASASDFVEVYDTAPAHDAYAEYKEVVNEEPIKEGVGELLKRPQKEEVLEPEGHATDIGFKHYVLRVIDGDTILLSNGERVRYIGVDTPELRSSDCFATEAFERNKELVEGKRVSLVKDVSETDRYDRLLRYVFVDGVMVNAALVEEGFARSVTYKPDTRFQESFDELQEEASREGLGLWGECEY